VQNDYVELLLREPDFTSAARLAMAVNKVFTNSASALDSTSVRIQVPETFAHNPIAFIALVEGIEVEPDVPARVIVNERTGTIVATAHIRIAPCAVAHGSLTISIANTEEISQPNAFSQTGTTAATTRTDTAADEHKGKLIPLKEMPTIEKVAAGLNSIGVTPRDMMAIFQAMKQAGALQAELIMR
jgi:flagellar P-ring protein precursor FlgI